MFVSQAHSFRQQARLAITLAWIAGYTNIVTILSCGTVVSHASGTTSNLGRDVGEGAWGLAAYAIFLLATFFVGAAVSGFCTEYGRQRGWESIYVLPIILETGLLFCNAVGTAIYGPDLTHAGGALYFMVGTASLAMGLQNATIARISNGDVRTTHVTGVLTDLGQEFSQLVWRYIGKAPPEKVGPAHLSPLRLSLRRVGLLTSIIGSFALGAGLGTWAFEHAALGAMFTPVVFLAWIVYQDVVLPIAEIAPHDFAGAGQGLELPPSLAIYQLAGNGQRGGESQRMPNLLAWSDRLPAVARVVILDVQRADWLNENAALEVRALLAHLTAQGRQLIVAGLSAEVYRRLNASGTSEVAPLENVCSDLELAIARGLALAHDLEQPEPPSSRHVA